MGNEHADELEKNGAVIKSKCTKEPEMLKQINIIKYDFAHQQRPLEEQKQKPKLPEHQRQN
jgi:hypothetical protein